MALNHRNIVVLCTFFTVSAAREGVHGAGSHVRHGASRLDALRPDKWPEVFKEDCAGSSQSPVDILISETEDMDLPEPLQVPDFEWAPAEVNIVNEGHTVKLLPVKNETSPLRGGPLTGDYILKELHFHWGAVNEEGSEHAIDSHYYAMEMHMVFDRKATRGRRPFRGTPGDTVVLAVFLKLAGDDNPALEPVVAALADVVEVGAAVAPKDAVSTADLLPVQREPMLVYNGSFTTPPCKETVTWILFEDPITVSGAQVEQFRTVKAKDAGPDAFLTKNRRPVIDRPEGLKGFFRARSVVRRAEAVHAWPSLALLSIVSACTVT